MDGGAHGVAVVLGHRGLGGLGAQLAEFAVAVAELGDLGGEFLDAWATCGFGHGARFEGVEIALDGGFGVFELIFGHGVFLAVVLDLRGVVFGDGGQGLVEQVAVGVGLQQGGEDGVFELGSGEALGRQYFVPWRRRE